MACDRRPLPRKVGVSGSSKGTDILACRCRLRIPAPIIGTTALSNPLVPLGPGGRPTREVAAIRAVYCRKLGHSAFAPSPPGHPRAKRQAVRDPPRLGALLRN